MSPQESTAHNNTPISSIEEITQIHKNNSLIKFNIDYKVKIAGESANLYLPEIILMQYLQKSAYNRLDLREKINGLMFWNSNRGPVPKMIIIPYVNYEALIKMGEPAKEFIDYFENKDMINIITNQQNRIDGISSKFSHDNITIKFSANNDIYVTLEKILHK